MLILQDMALSGTGVALLNVYGQSFCQFLGAIKLDGSISEHIIHAYAGGAISFRGIASLTGTVTGKRYECSFGGRIITCGISPDFIPGTIAGTCGESGVYC